MHVERILQAKGHSVISVRAGDLISQALATLAEHDIGAVLVRDGAEDVCGILSERDIVRALARDGDSCLGRPVSELMTSDLVSCAPDDLIDDVMALMTERRVRHLPVLADGELRGMISIGDVVKHRMEEVQREAEAMRDYITAAN